MDKVYKYGNKEYKMIEEDLALWDSSADLLLEYYRLKQEYTVKAKVDVRPITKYENRITELKIALETIADSKDATTLKQGKELKKKLIEVQEKFEADTEVASIKTLQQQVEGLVYYRLLRNKEFLKPIINTILIGDTEALDYKNKNIEPFLQEVITDFFLYSFQSNL